MPSDQAKDGSTAPDTTRRRSHDSCSDPLTATLNEECMQQILHSGTDLRAYSQQVESELREVENESIGDYIAQAENVVQLHNDIVTCDETLERLERMLCSFQADLGNICQEIVSLQEQSVALSVQMKNKQAIRGRLSELVDDLVVSESVIDHILDTPATEQQFHDSLIILDEKVHFVKHIQQLQKNPAGPETQKHDPLAVRDVMEILDKLKIKALDKTREYILNKMSSFRKPMTNYQIPQNALIKNKFYYKFLVTHDRTIAREIRAEYVDTMSKVYFSYFKEYISKLSKCEYEEKPDKDDLMASEDTAAKSSKVSLPLFSSSKPATMKNRSTTFTLGNRADILTKELESDLIVPHLTAKTEVRYPMEHIFRSHQYALVDNACREYLFLADFFILKERQTAEMFAQVFGKTTELLAKHVADSMVTNYDAIGLFLCLHIIYRYRLLAHKRSVPTLDPYWESVVRILWPQFEVIFQTHAQSVRTCDPERFGQPDTRPHFITRRYAEFAAAIISVNDTFPDERVSMLLSSLQTEEENLILKLASHFTSPKDQLIFIINNYDMILGVMSENAKESCKEFETMKAHLDRRTGEYVEEILYPHFGAMMSFVKECEGVLARGGDQSASLLAREEAKVAHLIRSFNTGWKKAIEEMTREVMSSFSNFRNGNNIQQAALAQMIQYYHRFVKVVSPAPFKNNPSKSELINIHQLMVEVRKYKTNF